jgi:phage repressor protein C with HTH and peptisase S24 domain
MFCFKVRGDSMYDKILPGAIVFVKQIVDISVIEYGQVFIVITEEQRMVKYVKRHPTNPDDMVLLRSHNNHYDDIDLLKEKIINLLLVKGYLNNYVL